MSILVTHKDCVNQSNTVFGQFGYDKWIPTTKKNAELKYHDTEELRNVGVGKTLVSCAMGASLEKHVDTLKKYRDRFDIITCDKGFKVLVDKGITPDYVQLADTNVETKWMGGDDSPLWEKTQGVALLSTPYGNHEWTKRWKGPIYFYVNKDAIRSEKRFGQLMPNMRVIPASTNVSNAMIVFATGSDEAKHENFMGYDRILLTGYDYSWKIGQNYYAFNDPKPKRFYMSHRVLMGIDNEAVNTSQNLFFSMKWMYSYLSQHPYLAVTNCSGEGILNISHRGVLEDEIKKISTDPDKLKSVRDSFDKFKAAQKGYEAAKREFEKAREAIYGSRR